MVTSPPPKPRRIILDLFGDYLRYSPGAQVRLGHLTTLLGVFDIAPATVRVTMSRLRRDGWFTSHREGRETIYQLTPAMLDVLDEGRERIFATPMSEWTNTWTMVIYQLSEEERQERDQLRKDLLWHGFGALTTSTWFAPGDRRDDAHRISAVMSPGRVEILRCLSDGVEQDRELAQRCWDLAALAAEYDAFLAEFRPVADTAETLDGPAALTARTLLISAYRHFPYSDPLLPEVLCPSPWVGDEAHRLFVGLHEALGPAAEEFVADVLGDREAVRERVVAGGER
ncbi:PaaX family transcriptional regulator C-terminal domain-containing protein [Gordonia sp. PKS22-38]|jgi:phenylacetic acid degradation operon negative regulatory protein|uniref:PaaX family transcriptional regulator C-terminal domain-containing protein n=1 Tax=Gordonia prachuapensis TaxID=3115651 RepID=A0ABU7MUY6_9ACTN|nr:PaaX family transcriptional regulator C-terminal domain-containing protein [Gordonia sp. PKS22-38]